MKNHIPIALFIFFICLFGGMIQSHNLEFFTLQHATAEAFARGVFHVGESTTSHFQHLGDTFMFHGKMYPVKAPGLALLGGGVYFFISPFLTYQQNYIFVSGLVSLCTVVLATSLAALISWRILSKKYSKTLSFLLIMSIFLGSNILVYGSVFYHDIFAVYALFITFLCLWLLEIRRVWSSVLLGILAVSSILFSFQAVFGVGMLLVYCSMKYKSTWKVPLFFFLGILLGLVPLLFYQWWHFGNPFLTPHGASLLTGSQFQDVYPLFTWDNLRTHFDFYFVSPVRSLFFYNPLILLGTLGLFFLPKSMRKEQYFMILFCVLHIFYVLSMQTVGHCQFGPRYLLYLLPFLSLGLLPILESHSRVVRGIFLTCLFLSVAINILGVITIAPNCDLWHLVWWKDLLRFVGGDISLPSFPFLFLLPGACISFCYILFALYSNSEEKVHSS